MLIHSKDISTRLGYGLTALIFSAMTILGSLLPATSVKATGHIVIDDCEELQMIGNDLGYPLDGDYVLGQDIPCEETTTWNWHAGSGSYLGFEPIGDASLNAFTGTVDGQNYKITGLYINRGYDTTEESHTALFAELSGGATISNLGLEDVDITGVYNAASFAGRIESSDVVVSDSWASGQVAASGNSGAGIVGTIGDESPTFDNVHAAVDVTGGSYSGGFVGQAYGGLYLDSSATGDVSCDGCVSLGGFAGYVEELWEAVPDGNGISTTTLFSSSYATGNVSCLGSSPGNCNYLGGFAGEVYGGSFVDSYASGNVMANTSSYVSSIGGFVGNSSVYFGGLILRSYALGNISGTDVDDYNIGGLVGQNSEGFIISESFARGDVHGGESIGGLVGYNNGNIDNSYARGAVSGNEDYSWYLGGLVGCHDCGDVGASVAKSYSTGQVTAYEDVSGGSNGGLVGSAVGDSVTNSFYDTDTSTLSNSDGGSGKTTALMHNVRTYTDVAFSDGLNSAWDFVANPYDDVANSDIWFIDPDLNGGYPCLSWQGQMCGLEGSVPAPSQDLNGDGIFDSTQSHVQGYTNPITSKSVALEVDPACTISSVSSTPESSNSVLDPGFDYPNGLMNFTIDCGEEVGEPFTVTIKQFYYSVDPADLVLRKHNPSTNAYFNVTGAVIAATNIYSQSVTTATYQVIDNGDLDLDPVSGIITDPAGLAKSVVGAPNTGLGDSTFVKINIPILIQAQSRLTR